MFPYKTTTVHILNLKNKSNVVALYTNFKMKCNDSTFILLIRNNCDRLKDASYFINLIFFYQVIHGQYFWKSSQCTNTTIKCLWIQICETVLVSFTNLIMT